MDIDVKELRAKLGISKSEFARRLGVTNRTVHRWEKGETEPSSMALRAIREVFGVKEG